MSAVTLDTSRLASIIKEFDDRWQCAAKLFYQSPQKGVRPACVSKVSELTSLKTELDFMKKDPVCTLSNTRPFIYNAIALADPTRRPPTDILTEGGVV